MSEHGNNPFQRTEQWQRDRCGYLTASNAWKVLKRSKRDGKKLSCYDEYKDIVIAERATGLIEWTPTTTAMQWGIDHEAEAREAYIRYRDLAPGEVELAGFLHHPTVEWLGASPDGLVNSDGLIEIKCPSTTTHLRRVRDHILLKQNRKLPSDAIPEEYRMQILLQLLVTGRKWCDYVDYDPRIAKAMPDKRLLVIRYQPLESELSDALEKCREFLRDVQDDYEMLVHC